MYLSKLSFLRFLTITLIIQSYIGIPISSYANYTSNWYAIVGTFTKKTDACQYANELYSNGFLPKVYFTDEFRFIVTIGEKTEELNADKLIKAAKKTEYIDSGFIWEFKNEPKIVLDLGSNLKQDQIINFTDIQNSLISVFTDQKIFFQKDKTEIVLQYQDFALRAEDNKLLCNFKAILTEKKFIFGSKMVTKHSIIHPSILYNVELDQNKIVLTKPIFQPSLESTSLLTHIKRGHQTIKLRDVNNDIKTFIVFNDRIELFP